MSDNRRSGEPYTHFVVRNDAYEQSPGYQHFLGHVLTELNKHMGHESARNMLNRTAALMANNMNGCRPNDPERISKDDGVFSSCLPRAFRAAYVTDLGNAHERDARQKVREKYLGPAGLGTYGLFQHEMLQRLKEETHLQGEDAAYYGVSLCTGGKDRGYGDILIANQGLDKGPIPRGLDIKFNYRIPGTKEDLPLMRIGYSDTLQADFASRYTGDAIEIEKTVVANFKLNYNGEIVFLHPHMTQEYFDKLIKCLDPLFEIIDTPPGRFPSAGTPPPEEKIDALITVHWLLSQTTPVIRGGSGMANLVREHLAEKLRSQGYEYETPILKAGVDLWGQAVTQSLRRYKERFKSGEYFDKEAKVEHIEDFLRQALEKAKAAAPGHADAVTARAADNGPPSLG